MQGVLKTVRGKNDISASSIWSHENVLDFNKSLQDRVDVGLDNVIVIDLLVLGRCRGGRVRLGAFLA